jgi:predicted ferric reductase
MRLTGLILIAALLTFPAFGFAAIAGARDPIAVFSQYLGTAALIVMAVVQVIATRLPGVEVVFGPMDQSYRLHKWLGIGAMIALLMHDTIDAEILALGQQNLLEEAAETLGELSLYGLIVLVVITVATFIPYHLWKWTHRLMGGFFTAGAALLLSS